MSRRDSFENYAGRVNYAAQVIIAGRDESRAFDGCFESYDGPAVAAALVRRAENNAALRANLPRYLGIKEATACYERYKGQNLTAVARHLRAEGEARAAQLTAQLMQERQQEQAIKTELTPAGEQLVIPGCEVNRSPKVKQLGLFG